MMRSLVAALSLSLMGGTVMAAAPAAPVASAAPATTVAAPAPADAVAESRPVDFGRVMLKLPVGDPYIVVQGGIFCATLRTLTYAGGMTPFNVPDAKETFRTEITNAGLKVVAEANPLFETVTASPADYVVGGMVTSFRQRSCSMPSSATKGDVHMTVEWQLYSRLQKQVVATMETSADFEQAQAVTGGGQVMLNKVFALNLQKLAADPKLRAALAGKARGEDELVRPTPQPPLALNGALAAAPRGVDAEAGSVVLVRTGGGHGSGFLVSSDGYVLTAAHVVGDATAVKIRWSDKTETDGIVVRVSKARDVALIKTDARGRPPLPIRKDLPTPGDTVFAVGAPWDQELQGSITRGVVSADRKVQGYTFVQSDVGVAPGASGGPLLDDHGRIVAITVSGMRFNAAAVGAPTQGINMFVPIGDAMSFLSLEAR